MDDGAPDLLIPGDDETHNEYRARLRAWADSIPAALSEGPGWRRQEWLHLCSLAGVAPDDD